MSTQQITIELPEPVMRQLMRTAAATHQSIEALVAQSVLSNLPPSVDNAPPELQTELLAMQGLSVEELCAIAQSQPEPAQRDRHTELLQKKRSRSAHPRRTARTFCPQAIRRSSDAA